jgi:hypothetical protein
MSQPVPDEERPAEDKGVVVEKTPSNHAVAVEHSNGEPEPEEKVSWSTIMAVFVSLSP